jgi:hypothetical protein
MRKINNVIKKIKKKFNKTLNVIVDVLFGKGIYQDI